MSNNAEALSPFVPVIPAGGSGTRLWPLSRAHHPKFLVDLTGAGSSLLEQTVDRVAPYAAAPPIVVTGAMHVAAVCTSLGDRVRVLAEPSARNSMPAIAWAAAVAYANDPEAVIGSFAADHVIDDVDAFGSVLNSARRAAELGYLVTIGIEPTYPACGFGYIETAVPNESHDSEPVAAAGAEHVARFVEKPSEERAREFLETGRFVWNAGMFVAKARVVLEELDRLLPSVSAAARTLVETGADGVHVPVPEHVWESMTAIAIDHALAEPLAVDGKVATVRATFEWNDIGDYRALAAQLREGQAASDGAPGAITAVTGANSDVRVLGGARVLPHGAQATVYSASSRPVVLVGVSGVSVVETDEALLVISDDHAQDLSSFVKNLGERGYGELA